MPFPLIVMWAVGVLGTTGAAGSVYGKHKKKRATTVTTEAVTYVEKKRQEFELKQRTFVERLRSYAQIIKASINNPPGNVKPAPPELTAEMRAVWNEVRSSISSVSVSSDIVISDLERTEAFRKIYALNMATRRPDGTSPVAAVAASAFFAYDGATQAVAGQRTYNKAASSAIKAREDADRMVSALESANEKLGMAWDNCITPLIGRAVGPPPDETFAAALLEIAEDMLCQADRQMKVASR